MKLLALLLTLSVVSLLGCSTTGGTIGNLIPAPKFLKGDVKDSKYHAADGSLEINTPFPQRTPAYTYMEVKERYASTGAYVSFNSSVAPNEIYRIEVGKKLDESQLVPKFEDVVEIMLRGYKQQLLGYGTEPVEEWRTETSLGGKRAMLVTLRQTIPLNRSYRGSSGGYVAHHILYVVESTGGAGAVWIQWPHGCDACAVGPENDVLETHERIRSFLTSFHLKI